MLDFELPSTPAQSSKRDLICSGKPAFAPALLFVPRTKIHLIRLDQSCPKDLSQGKTRSHGVSPRPVSHGNAHSSHPVPLTAARKSSWLGALHCCRASATGATPGRHGGRSLQTAAPPNGGSEATTLLGAPGLTTRKKRRY